MSTSNLLILIIEDDDDDFVHICQLLKKGAVKVQVDRAATAQAGLLAALEDRHDVCFLDYRLGEHSGLDILRKLRRGNITAPVIFLTGQGDEEIAVEAMKAGATDYLLKARLTVPLLEAALRFSLTLREKEDAVRIARHALQASEQRFRALVENSSDAITLMDPEGTIVYASQSIRSLLGYTPEELVETDAFQYVHPDDVAAVRDTFHAILHSPGVPMRMELRFGHKDKTWRYLEAIGVNRLHEPAVGAVVINERDVTERKRAENELRAAEQEYRMLFERNLAGVFRVSAEGKFLAANDSLARMLGYEHGEQLLGRFKADFAQAGELDRLLGELEHRDHVVSYELKARRKNGETACLLMNSSVLRDEKGNCLGREGTVLDITERRALELQLLQAQKMDAVGQLAGGVAHDFNNLLMVISSYAELLTESIGDANDKAYNQAKEIEKAARRAAALTQQLLAFSRKQMMMPRLMDMNTVVSEFGKMLPRLIGEDIRVTVTQGEGLWKVKADPVQIEQLIMNLAVNARDAMPRGGSLVVETSNIQVDEAYCRLHLGMQPGEHVMLTVSDTGCGIAPEVLPRIFEPFFTTKEHGKGTGLGLSTVYGIVKQSGGTVNVYSEPEHGTVFKVYLPRADAAMSREEDEVETVPPPRGSETILLVEDEQAVRQIMIEYLNSRGYSVVQGKNGQDALQMLQDFSGKMDLLITDVIMPGMSGAELAGRVKEIKPDIRVLFISGYTESMVVRHGIDETSGFLQKPFTLASMACKVREVLDAKQEPGEATELAAAS